MPTPLLFFLSAVAAIIVLTGGVGVSLAVGVYLLDNKIRQTLGPLSLAQAGAIAPSVAKPGIVTHRAAGPGAAIFALVILITGIVVGRYVPLMPVAASSQAEQVDLLFNTMLGIAVVIFLLVEGALVYSVFRYRRKKGEAGDGVPIHGSNRLEFAWTVIPALIVLWLGAYSYQILAQIRTPPLDPLTVEVTSRQFQWEFHYPEAGITSNDLHVPDGKAIQLKIKSEDVIHSFWVPAFRVKQDAFPMRETEIYFTANIPGEYRVVCAELCGVGHAKMGLTSYVVVQSQLDFDAWIADQQAAAGKPPDPVALFTKYGCVTCHTLTAAGATGLIGPDLNGIGTNAGTRVPGLSAEDYIRQSILSPNAFIAPKCPSGPCPSPSLMPLDFAERMPKSHLDALVNILLQQK
jgi:cytochrome c oxidase subunit 2